MKYFNLPRLAALALFFLTCSVATAQTVQELRPNLKAVPAFDIAFAFDIYGQPEIRFSAESWNAGLGPLELIAGEVTSQGKQKVYQRVYRSDGSYYDVLAGTFEYHPSHNHFHFEDYALYTLQQVGAPGSSARTSAKTSFCIMDTTAVDKSLPGAPKRAVYTTCGNVKQGMSVGWGDVYGASLPGQEISLTDLTDGDYELSIDADPKGRLLETDESDNHSCVLVHISMSTQSLTVLDPNGCGTAASSVSVASITPSSAAIGSTVQVTIVGSGFAPGMAVTFDNGSGSRPVASSVVVVDSTHITASVTVNPKKGTARDPVWDLHVDTGVLPDAFLVY